MSTSVQVPSAPHMSRMMGPPRFPPPSQMNHHHHSGPHHHGHGPSHRQRLSYQPYRLYPRPPPPGAAASAPGNAADGSEYDGRILRKRLVRKTVDYNAAVIKQIQVLFCDFFKKIKFSLLPFCYFALRTYVLFCVLSRIVCGRGIIGIDVH